MARPGVSEDDKIMETWEACTRATTWVNVWDRRNETYKAQRVGGRSGSRRLHISRDDRKFNQENIPEENKGLDPFTNGTLRLVETASRDETLETRYHKTDDELREYLELRDPTVFREALSTIESKMMLHRILVITESEGTVAQLHEIRELIRERWPIGGSQRTYREMEEAGERLGVAQI